MQTTPSWRPSCSISKCRYLIPACPEFAHKKIQVVKYSQYPWLKIRPLPDSVKEKAAEEKEIGCWLAFGTAVFKNESKW